MHLIAGKRLALSLLTALVPIPVEISSTDVREYLYVPPSVQEPMMKEIVAQLDGTGLDYLGPLLWSFILFQGIFTVQGRPGDWVLPLVAKALPGGAEKPWLKDYEENLKFTAPLSVDLIRFGLFLVAGYYLNFVITNFGFEGVQYWSSAIAGALFIPVSLLALARGTEPKLDRAQKVLEDQLFADFRVFAARRLSVSPPSQKEKTSEIAILRQFRVMFPQYRDDTIVPDKVIRKTVRLWLGTKPKDGEYKGLVLSDASLEAEQALQENLRKAQEARRDMELDANANARANEVETDLSTVGEMSEFVRR